jgi:plasmid stabilization system protein ParE
MKLRFSRQARKHLLQIRVHIAAHRPLTAELVRGRILESIRSLQEVPRLGRAGCKHGTRELVVRGLPYIIVYIIAENDTALVVLGIFHAARER